MKIIKLLELHNQFKGTGSLSQNFGDGYLLKYNRIFKNIRTEALNKKYQFSNEFNPNYQALPLAQLEVILTHKKIPYVDNVTALDRLVRQLKDAVNVDDISHGFKRNYVFHEACHAVIRDEIEKVLHLSENLKTIDNQRKKCFQMLFEESFSNTCELMAVIDAQEQAHKIFYEMNSYTFLFNERSNIKKAMEEMGQEFIFKFFMLTYLYSNFLHNSLNNQQLNEIVNLISGGKPFNLKILKSLSKIPFTLDLQFRIVTTSLHLRLSGLDKKPQDLLNFNFMEIFLNEKAYPIILDKIAKISLK